MRKTDAFFKKNINFLKYFPFLPLSLFLLSNNTAYYIKENVPIDVTEYKTPETETNRYKAEFKYNNDL